MPNGASGQERVVTLKKKSGSAASNWALTDATAPGSGDVLLVKSPARPQRDLVGLEDDSMGAERPVAEITNGAVSCKSSLNSYLHYDAKAEHLLFALAMGTSGGTPSTPGGGSSSRDQTFTPALNIDGIVATLCEGPSASNTSRQPSASIVPSMMITGFEISGEGDGPVEIKADYCGIDCLLKPAPANDPLPGSLTLNASIATIAAATNGNGTRRVRMGDLQLYLDAAGGAQDFASGASAYLRRVRRFSFKFGRDLDYPQYGSQEANAYDNYSRPIMPLNNAKMIMPTLSVLFDRYTDDEDFGKWIARTSLRARLEFTGDLIEGSLYQRFRIDLPLMKATDAKLGNEPGNITRPVTWNCYKSSSTPTGFAASTELIALRNTQTANLLA